MRKIIASTYATVDGFIDNPHEWSLQYSNEQAQNHAFAMTLGADALLLGRTTYEGMAQAWPNMGGNPYADHVNTIAKYVVASAPVDTSHWGPTVVVPGAELIPEVAALKEQDGDDILIWGTGRLTDTLTRAGLLDEYRIWICPVIKGGGEPLFRPDSTSSLELVDSTTFDTGAVVLAYRPVARCDRRHRFGALRRAEGQDRPPSALLARPRHRHGTAGRRSTATSAISMACVHGSGTGAGWSTFTSNSSSAGFPPGSV
jgi:dihydrofolate reductase